MGQDDLAKCWSGSRMGTAGTNIVVGQKDADELFFCVEQLVSDFEAMLWEANSPSRCLAGRRYFFQRKAMLTTIMTTR
jgi:hypothetical protein